MKTVAVVVALLALAGCARHNPYELVATTTAEFTLVSVNPPKHFYVDLVTAAGIRNTYYVSKHCNRWREVVIGTKYTLMVDFWLHEDGTSLSRVHAYKICPGN